MAGLCIKKGEKQNILDEINMSIEDEDQATKDYAHFGKALNEKMLCGMGGELEKNQAGGLSLSLLTNLSKDEAKHASSLRELKKIVMETPECD